MLGRFKEAFLENKKAICMISIIMLFAIIMCAAKQGYHMDELWSYGLANSYYMPAVNHENRLSEEVNGKFFHDYITVNSGEEHCYDSVLYNLRYDTHPPLSFLLLHCVSSLFPDKFSKWYALGTNLICYLILLIALYLLAKAVNKNNCSAILICLAYGISAAGINTVTYARMYCMVTMLLVLWTYIFVRMVIADNIRTSELIAFAVISFMGFMTQYFFILYAAICIFTFAIAAIVKKQFFRIIKLLVPAAIGIIAGFIVFDSTYQHLFKNNSSGVNWLSTLSVTALTEYIKYVLLFCREMDRQLFGYLGQFLIIVIAVILYKNKVKLKSCLKLNNRAVAVISMMAGAAGYFIIVSKVAPYREGRYLFMIYPIIVLLIITAMDKTFAICECRINTKKCLCIFTIIMALISLAVGVDYIYPGEAETISKAEQHSGIACIYVSDLPYEVVREAVELQNFGTIRVMSSSDVEQMGAAVNDLNRPEKFVLCTGLYLGGDELLQKISEITGYLPAECIKDKESKMYIMQKSR